MPTLDAHAPCLRWRPRAGLWWALGLLLLISGLGHRAYDFYLLDVQARVDHPAFRRFSPAGPVGQLYGLTGTALFFTNLLYLLRRRLTRMRFGSMRRWLDVHVLTGLLGSVLVTFHSAFQVRSSIAAMTSVSLGLVVASGLVGRFLYAIKRGRHQQRRERVMNELRVLSPGMARHVVDLTGRFAPPPGPTPATLLASLRLIPRWRRQARLRRRSIQQLTAAVLRESALSPAGAALIRARGVELGLLWAADVEARAGGHLLNSWRGLHRFMALLMLSSVVVHIAVAAYFGFSWPTWSWAACCWPMAR